MSMQEPCKNPMVKKLEHYRAAAVELALIEEELHRFHQVHDSVKGSMPEHPFTLQTIAVSGIDLDSVTLLQDRKAKLANLRRDVEGLLATVDDPHIAALLRLRYVKGLKWEQVADKMGAGYTGGSLKLAAHRYLKRCNGCNVFLC